MLYFIPTPIGNRDDITIRAMKLFQSLEFFVCEDTRTTMKLMGMYDIPYKDKTFFSLTSFTSTNQLGRYIDILKTKDIGLVSEAGTPGLSDPGKSMIQLCNENKIPYTILPGANALIPAVVGAGFDTSEFVYRGFLPTKKGRQTKIKEILQSEIPVFMYESVHRIEKFLQELSQTGFQGQISIARELSKMFEQYFTGTVEEALVLIKEKKLPIKGEFVIGIKNIAAIEKVGFIHNLP
ncbi:MAG TPA: 16S rRNA (cytidine(1402)-2'-O)-methyltransferase [Candidatus Absconditabacterales bacterium]|nr:16S rRNA (cytidine(1402)-2'-O)-methyltransferase [Candidatus Absconditabacterales bacterium]